jgi:hypothetical protein
MFRFLIQHFFPFMFVLVCLGRCIMNDDGFAYSNAFTFKLFVMFSYR